MGSQHLIIWWSILSKNTFSCDQWINRETLIILVISIFLFLIFFTFLLFIYPSLSLLQFCFLHFPLQHLLKIIIWAQWDGWAECRGKMQQRGLRLIPKTIYRGRLISLSCTPSPTYDPWNFTHNQTPHTHTPRIAIKINWVMPPSSSQQNRLKAYLLINILNTLRKIIVKFTDCSL